MGYLQHHTQVSIIYSHTHKITYLYILLYMSAQEHVTSTTRGEKQKFGILHTSGCPRTVQMMGRVGGTEGKYQEACLFACFWDQYGSLAML